MTIGAILRDKGGEVVSAAPTTTVGEAVRLLHERRIGAVPVKDGGAVVGVFSERDVIRALAERGATALDAPVTEAMSAPAITTEPAAPVLGALSQMTRRRVRHLPVVDGGTVVGIVSIGDLVKYRIDRLDADAAAMREYIQSA
jgi:CBS domain-containing protein